MTWMEILLACIVIFIVVCLISIWHASTHFHKVFYRLSSDKISEPVKFVLLSDLHDRKYGKDNEKLLHAIYEENPDAVLVAGDMLTALEERKEKVAEHFIRALGERYTIYYGLGNHEAKMGWGRKRFGNRYEEYMDAIKASGAKVLRNEFMEYPKEPIRIYGLDMSHRYYKRLQKTRMEEGYLEETLGRMDAQYYNILLAHNPTYFEDYAKLHPDLVLSGHVHGGLVRLPFLGGVISPALKLFPKYDGGKFVQGDSTMILSRGLGIHSVEFRMWNPAELVVIEIVPKDK
ncbi:MAG: metallophosphoesterase [Lachnospiraceae bacterium]|nr:metallophosphoesterase [Lachnospiraceae bacterium]